MNARRRWFGLNCHPIDTVEARRMLVARFTKVVVSIFLGHIDWPFNSDEFVGGLALYIQDDESHLAGNVFSLQLSVQTT